MIVKQIVLNNFRNFEGVHSFTFDKINLIQGANGAGKSTLGRIAFIYAVYGEYEDSLVNLPTRGKSKSCKVAVKIEDNQEEVTVTRSLPTKVEIQVNGIEILQGALNVEKDRWLRARFGDYNYFKRFRMIDKDNSVSILDEGATALRKTLVSMNESILTNIKKKLSDKKSLYDKYNKDTGLVYKHYPSEKRYYKLVQAKKELTLKYRELNNQQEEFNRDRNLTVSEISKHQYRISQCNVELTKLAKSTCITCGQAIQIARRNELFIQLEEEIEQLQKAIVEREKELNVQAIASNQIRDELAFFVNYGSKINVLMSKLDTRIKQKDYKYTTKDVLNVTNAIKELEKFYSQFIMLSVKNLEPIINNITNKIGINVFFDLDAKGNFDIKIQKKDYEELFSYKDLSSGQRLVLCVAFQMAILIDKGQSGIIVADEGFNNLSEETAKMIFEIFSDSDFQLISILHRFENIPEGIKVISLL